MVGAALMIAGGCGGHTTPSDASGVGTTQPGAADPTAPAEPEAAPQANTLDDMPSDSFGSIDEAVEAMTDAAAESDSRRMQEIGKWIAARGPEAVAPLKEVLLDEQAPMPSRVAATQAIWRVGASAAPVLIAAVDSGQPDDSGDSQVRVQAVKALYLVRPVPPEIITHLTQWIDHPDPRVQQAAMETLSRIGPKAEAATKRLQEILADPNEPDDRRTLAKKTLKEVNPRRTFQD